MRFKDLNEIENKMESGLNEELWEKAESIYEKMKTYSDFNGLNFFNLDKFVCISNIVHILENYYF